MSRPQLVSFQGTVSGAGGDAVCEGTALEVEHPSGIDVAHTGFRITRVTPQLPDGEYVAFIFGRRQWVKCIDGVWTSK
jgi:hypothetical protein